MKFYNRENELHNLETVRAAAEQGSKMSIIVGRRRIGKTALIKKAYAQKVYLFVSKKDEALLCEEFVRVIQNALDVRIFGEFRSFARLFEYLMQLATQRAYTLIIDEFQEFLQINKSIYSDMQNIWDAYKDSTRMNLVLSGSVYSLMKRIFENSKEPLFGRADNRILLKPFRTATLKAILADNHPTFQKRDLLALYILTGGVAKYVETFVDRGALTFDAQLNVIFDHYSLFLDEGKNLLIEEFGKEYATYFSILSLIASSKTARSDIESILGKNIGGHIERLEQEYSVIRKIRPICAKVGGRTVKYEIADNFLNFWFRFIYKHRSAIEIENYDYVKQIVRRDFSQYSGRFLEKYIIDQLMHTGEYSAIGTYWERGNQNEIDIVAINDLQKTVLVADVKIDPKKIDLGTLKTKADKLRSKYPGYSLLYRGYSLEDI